MKFFWKKCYTLGKWYHLGQCTICVKIGWYSVWIDQNFDLDHFFLICVLNLNIWPKFRFLTKVPILNKHFRPKLFRQYFSYRNFSFRPNSWFLTKMSTESTMLYQYFVLKKLIAAGEGVFALMDTMDSTGGKWFFFPATKNSRPDANNDPFIPPKHANATKIGIIKGTWGIIASVNTCAVATSIAWYR